MKEAALTYAKLLRICNVDCSSLSFWQYNLTKNPVTDISVLPTHTKLQEHDN